jgi:ATP-dependent RNA helicase RhlB
MTTEHLSQQNFSDLSLPPSVAQGIQDAGFTRCTPIQAEALPPALAGHDVAGQAQTGTGKTAAFLLALFTRLVQEPPRPERRTNQPRALVLAPTRELAIQIHKDAVVLGAHTGLKLGLVYGGTGYEEQRQALEAGVDVLIGTPGRIIDYFKQHVFDLKALQVFVLDEADRMFDLGFIKDIRFLMRRMPPANERLSMLFSATLSYRVMELAYEHMNNPQLVKVETDNVTVEAVTEVVYYPANAEKIPLLIGLLRHMDPRRSMVFVNTKDVAEKLRAWLDGNGFRAEVLSGDVPQNKRERLLEEFRSGDLPILVATDVAARGLHVPDVSHVFNFDLPQDAEDYVHRVGRTARAGASGDAISFACEKYAYSLMDIQEYVGHELPVAKITEDLLPELDRPSKMPERNRDRRGGGRDGGRGGREQRGARGPRSGERSARGGGEGRGRGSDNRRGPRPETRAKTDEKPAEPVQQNQPAPKPKEPKEVTETPLSPRRPKGPETPAIG